MVVHVRCDSCGRLSATQAGTVQDVRRRLKGWVMGYVHKPYSGKRADYCPRCAAHDTKRGW